MLLPSLEEDPPDPAAPIDKRGDAAAAPAIAEDRGTLGDVIATELPDNAGGATGLMLVPDFDIISPESLIAGVA
jgi:hypothetical protein